MTSFAVSSPGEAETNRWHIVPIVLAYALTSFMALCLFLDADISPFGSLDGDSVRLFGRLAWFPYLYLYAGLSSLAHMAILSRTFRSWRTFRWRDLHLASAAAAIASAYLFVMGLRIALATWKGPVNLVTSTTLALIIAAVSTFVVLTATKRLRTDSPGVTSRWTALATSILFVVSSFVAMFGAHMLPWRELHIVEWQFGNDYVSPPRTLLMLLYLEFATLIAIYAEIALLLWLLHAILLTVFFQRWRGLTQRSFVVGSLASGFLTAVITDVMKASLERSIPGPEPSDLSPVWVAVLLAIVLMVVAPVVAGTFISFEALAKRRVRSAPATV